MVEKTAISNDPRPSIRTKSVRIEGSTKLVLSSTTVECEGDWNTNFSKMKEYMVVGLMFVALCLMGCMALVPLCGCYGAKQDNRGCTLCFMGWNLALTSKS